MPPKVVSGARAKVGIYDPATGQTTIVGIWSDISYSLQYDVQPVYILGRYSASELDYTSMDVVRITATGWRTIKNSPHVAAAVPRLQDLLNHEYLEFAIIDRQLEAEGGDGRIAKIRNIRPEGYSQGFSARQLSSTSYSFVGLLVDTEDATNSEHPTSTNLP